MTRIQQKASLAEKAVQKVATDSVKMPKARKARTQATKNGEPVHTRLSRLSVHPMVWAKALELAGGDVKRIEIHHATEVVVKNPRH